MEGDYGTGTWSTNSTLEKEEGLNSWRTLREINYLEYLAVGLALLPLGCLLNSVQCSGFGGRKNAGGVWSID